MQIGFADQPSHPLIGVETIGEWDAISAEIGRIAAQAAPGAVIDFMPVDRTKSEGVMASLLQTEPFLLPRTPTT